MRTTTYYFGGDFPLTGSLRVCEANARGCGAFNNSYCGLSPASLAILPKTAIQCS
jgi:hypothetical protein